MVRFVFRVALAAASLLWTPVFSQAPVSSLSIADALVRVQGKVDGLRATEIGAIAPLLNNALAVKEAADLLGTPDKLAEGYRSHALYALASNGKLGMLGSDAAVLLQGTTAGNRAVAIGYLAPLAKGGFTTEEAAALLGTPDQLREGYRANALYSLASARTLGVLGSDASLLLDGTTGGNRSVAIGYLAPFMEGRFTSGEAAALLGTAIQLSEGFRANAIYALTSARKIGMLGSDASLLLDGTTGGNRAVAIGYLAPLFHPALTAQELSIVLGSPEVLDEGFRANAIHSLMAAGKVAPGLAVGALGPVMNGISGALRASALAELTSVPRASAAPSSAASSSSANARPNAAGGRPPAQGNAGATASANAASKSAPVAGPAAPATQGNVAAHIVATVFGESVNEGGTLRLRVPLYVGIEVAFEAAVTQAAPGSARSGSPATTPAGELSAYRFQWFVNGKPQGQGAHFVQWMNGGGYHVGVRAEPVTAAARGAEKAREPAAEMLDASVRVLVFEKKEWDCKGRLGAGCNDHPAWQNVGTSSVTVIPDCTGRGRKGEICIASMMSGGAIAHDICCGTHPSGHGCPAGNTGSDCQAEWHQATVDRVEGRGGDGLISMFPWTWIYPPDGADGPSSGGAGWWVGVANEGTIISRNNVAPNKDLRSICRSGDARREITVLPATGQTAGPMGAKDQTITRWVCR